MSCVPTANELRRKADETRDEAKTFETLELREQMIKLDHLFA